MMNRLFLLASLSLVILLGCNSSSESTTGGATELSDDERLERDLKMYEQVWFDFLNNGDTLAVNAEHFTEDVTIITDQGNIVGIKVFGSFT